MNKSVWIAALVLGFAAGTIGLLARPGRVQVRSGPATAYDVYGIGGSASCGRWTATGQGRRTAESVEHAAMLSWVMGFVTGTHYARNVIVQSGEGNGVAATALKQRITDSAALGAWLDEHCAANPGHSLDDATQALIVAVHP